MIRGLLFKCLCSLYVRFYSLKKSRITLNYCSKYENCWPPPDDIFVDEEYKCYVIVLIIMLSVLWRHACYQLRQRLDSSMGKLSTLSREVAKGSRHVREFALRHTYFTYSKLTRRERHRGTDGRTDGRTNTRRDINMDTHTETHMNT